MLVGRLVLVLVVSGTAGGWLEFESHEVEDGGQVEGHRADAQGDHDGRLLARLSSIRDRMASTH